MFLVVFRNRKRADIDAAVYDAEAARMEEMAASQPGYLSFTSYTAEDGEVIALSEWADEQSAGSWGAQVEHREAQRRGRESYYESYTLFACADPRIHHFDRSKN